VSEAPAQAGSYEVTCPHCGKDFEADLLEGDAARYNGFKCPHCRLFVPYERVDETAKPA
jgi:DNA-directed RNA polymerase subunit RPC12/RpoP